MVEWIVNEIILRHGDMVADDPLFYQICARKHVERLVRRCVGKYDANPGQQDENLVLPGFEHLQIAYSVERNGTRMLVPVGQLSNAELAARADEYRAMANGCKAHAAEIEDYIRARGEAA